jgi:hypothetical protein
MDVREEDSSSEFVACARESGSEVVTGVSRSISLHCPWRRPCSANVIATVRSIMTLMLSVITAEKGVLNNTEKLASGESSVPHHEIAAYNGTCS